MVKLLLRVCVIAWLIIRERNDLENLNLEHVGLLCIAR